MHCFFRKMLLVILTLIPASAWAGFHVCNDTAQDHYVAIASKSHDAWRTVGWHPVAKSTCEFLLDEDLNSRFVYFRLLGVDEQFLHNSIKFCASNEDFSGTGSQECHTQRLAPKDFARVDVGRGTTDFSVNLSDFLRVQQREEVPVVSINAVFQTCRQQPSRGILCSFVGQDHEVITHLTDSTPRGVVRTLTRLHRGAPARISARVDVEILSTIEVSVEFVERRSADTAYEVLVDLQGTWVSQMDPNDSFIVDGATRRNAYLGAVTHQEFISISDECLDFEIDGLALYSWSQDVSGGLCYEIESLEEDVLTLRFLPGGRVLKYQRKPTS
ncbi:DUF1036 domain-containing protein [Epibacterium ulvae]|uniref:DUF1036 domain-containing protein n=1 Tax=Epibacterium ulvae TaxID=1156985 RepID=UPI001BFC40B7|nr:DUF1036 domain-containing protein [Epibacterium ulvae]MBT8155564.1 DUF1036 domain-containing protein [Epibacterium ulvae]